MMDLADGPWQQAGWGGGPCFLIALLVLGGLVAAGWALWKRKGPGRGDSGAAAAKRSAAEETLADRYARGDLSEEEYWEKLSVVREAQSR